MIRIDFTKKEFEKFKNVAEEFREAGLLLVADGFVECNGSDKIWWHYQSGPTLTTTIAQDYHNILKYPEFYSIQEPEVETTVQYKSLFVEE